MLGGASVLCKGFLPAVGLPVWSGVDALQSSSGSLITLLQVVSLPSGHTPQELLGSMACLPHHACTSFRLVMRGPRLLTCRVCEAVCGDVVANVRILYGLWVGFGLCVGVMQIHTA